MVKTYTQKLLPKEMSQNGFIAGLANKMQSYGYEVRVIGGAVRDLLMKETNDDFDLSTTATPAEILNCLKNHNDDYYVIPTGIKHGTVTINDKHSTQHIELTSLRKDIICDGRHAEVEYGVSWEEDALRRDFTFNSLSLDFEGRVFDYSTGYQDAKDKYLRFVGDPTTRIKEDALRILRFFRFLTTKSSSYDEKALSACLKHKSLIQILSGERIWQECKTICQHQNGMSTWNDLGINGILSVVFPEFEYEKSWLKGLFNLENKISGFSRHDSDNGNIIRSGLLARISAIALKASVIQKRLKISSALKKDIHACQQASMLDFDKANLRRHLWHSPKHKLQDWIYTIGAKSEKSSDTVQFVIKKTKLLENTKSKKFPINGSDIKKYGLRQGLELGKVLYTLQEWWLKFDSPPNRKATLDHLQNIINYDGR